MSGSTLNLKLPVSYRTYSWEELVIREWGQQWGVWEVAYEFSNGRTALNTDYTTNGFYKTT